MSSTMMNGPQNALRVTQHEQDVQDLMNQFPKLTRTEIADVISGKGPLRADVERELLRVSNLKR